MTRINLINPSMLTDQHLMAEYREIKMINAALGRSKQTKTTEEILCSIPHTFCLGAGHVKFFYDKGRYLFNRYLKIRAELLYRNYKIDGLASVYPWSNHFPEDIYFKDWSPAEADLGLIKARIQERIDMKPEWYRYHGKKLNPITLELLTFRNGSVNIAASITGWE